MKNIILGMLIAISLLEAKSCLSKNERNQLGISGIPSDFQYVPNYIKCDKDKSKLEEFVCKDRDYLLMFHYLSEANVDFWERNYKRELNHKTWNIKSMKQWEKKYNTQSVNYNQLCFDLKDETTDLKGGESPYKKLELFNMTFFFQKNKYGATLISRNQYKIYLGKSCDVLDSKKKNGYWYKKNEKYLIELDSREIDYFYEEIDLAEYACSIDKVLISKLKKVLQKYPTRTVAHYNLADAYWALGEKKKAIASYTTYIEQMCDAGKEKRIPQVVRDRVSSK
jgi:hypothetical protein